MINEEIRDPEVRVIGSNGEAIGIMSSREAQEIAYSQNLDLVKIGPNAVPPTCKIMDYGKYVFDKAKREKEAKKNQKVIEIKEVRLGLGIGEHDYQVKLKNAIKFLQGGDKVKVSVKFVGREMNYTQAGEELINRMLEDIKEYGTADKKAKLEGRRMNVIVNPKN